MLKKIFVFNLFFLYFCISIYSNTASRIDSLNILLKQEKNEAKRLEHIVSLGELYKPSPSGEFYERSYLSKMKFYSEKIDSLSPHTNKSDETIIRIALFQSYIYRLEEKFQKAAGTLKEINILIDKTNNIKLKYTYYFYLGIVVRHRDNNLALSYFEKAMDYALNSKQLADVLTQTGYALYMIGQNNKSIKCFKEALDIYLELKEAAGTDHCYHNIGLVYLAEKDIENSKHFFYKSFEIGKEQKDTTSMIISCYIISDLLIDEKEYREAELFILDGISWNKSLKSNLAKSRLYFLQGKLNFARADYDLAHFYSQKALTVAKEVKSKRILARTYRLLINLAIKKKDWDLALKLGNTLWELISEDNEYVDISKTAKLLIKIHTELKNYKELSYYYPIYFQAKDTLQSLESIKIINRIKYELEVEKKDADISYLKEKEESQNLRSIYISLLLLLSLLVILFLYLYNRKIKKAAEQEALLLEKEQELRKQEQLQRAQRTNLFANLSHDFRTPLSLIKIPLDEMIDHTFEGDKENAFKMMSKNTSHLLNLTNEMLDLSKIEEGNIQLNPIPSNLSKIIKEELFNYVSLATSKLIDVEFFYPQKELLFNVDMTVFIKIFHNLVSNAFKFTPENGSISLKIFPKKDCWKFIVKDSGKGITKEEMPYIFNKYYRGVLEKNQVEIGGLGLALIKEYMNIQNGNIEVETEVGVGTAFTLSFPYLKPQNSNFENIPFSKFVLERGTKKSSEIKKSATEYSPSPFALIDSKKISILVLEDNQELNKMMFERLNIEYNVLQAFNGKEGLEMAKEHIPDLIITDIMMPIMNGVEFSKQLEMIPEISHIPVIVTSALNQGKERKTLWEQGIIDFIEKPIDFKILKYKINNLLKNRQQFKEQLFKKGWKKIKEDKALISVRDKKFLDSFILIIEENYSDSDFELTSLPTIMLMSRTSIYKKVKSLTGLSPISFLLKTRLHKAKKMIENKEGPINEIAMNVGMPNHSHFSRNFKKEFGITPKEYLKK